ncbi:MAG: hypothetical protein M0T73_10900 [Deltaproteobacteria bacterium]|jgi:hypothetical protein|nr:hypothetical protein [Deltaproteobacteria bacterium]
MAILKSKINTSYGEADRTNSGRTHRNVQLKEKGVSCPTDDKASKDEMLENILRKYRSAWKKLAKL